MIVGILIFQAVAFAVLSGIVADQKNRDVAKWSIIGFLFGIFGFVAALIVETVEPEDGETEKKQPSGKSNRQPTTTRKFDPDEHEKKCPDCAEYIKLEARVCHYCGHEFSDEEVKRQVDKAKQEAEEERKKGYDTEEVLSTHNFKGVVCEDCGEKRDYIKSKGYICPEN